MLYKTKGIVINFLKYGDTSIIVKIYTRLFGWQSYIVNGVRSKTIKNLKIALYQPLTLLDLVVYHKNKDQIHRISEAKCSHPWCSIPYQTKKSAIGLFMAEVISKTLRETSENTCLFDFIEQSISILDQKNKHYENHHLQFLIQLSYFLGFGPSSVEDIAHEVRDLQTESMLEPDQKLALNQLLQSQYGEVIQLSNQNRRLLLEEIISFYQFHNESFRPMKSVAVLKEVLED